MHFRIDLIPVRLRAVLPKLFDRPIREAVIRFKRRSNIGLQLGYGAILIVVAPVL